MISTYLFAIVLGCSLLTGCAAEQLSEKTIQDAPSKTGEAGRQFVRELPERARECLEQLNGPYVVEWRINPVYQRGKFGRTVLYDYAVAVTQQGSGKPGIVLCHRGDTPTMVLGAGQGFGDSDRVEFEFWRVCSLRFGKTLPDGSHGHEMVDTILIRTHDGTRAMIHWEEGHYEKKAVTDSYIPCWD
jgi:hypothetical protein